ncbi:hypothetical protein [Peribacillus muralis]|nr:hypothetical protein [Peribacillus muralis]
MKDAASENDQFYEEMCLHARNCQDEHDCNEKRNNNGSDLN